MTKHDVEVLVLDIKEPHLGPSLIMVHGTKRSSLIGPSFSVDTSQNVIPGLPT